MKINKLGTNFLDELAKKKNSAQINDRCQDRRPLITPFITNSASSSTDSNDSSKEGEDEQHGQQYLLIPNIDHIQVLSMEHGQAICKFSPYNSEDEALQNAKLQSVAIMKRKIEVKNEGILHYSDEWVVFAGFLDGTLHEWTLSSIALNKGKNVGILPVRRYNLPQKYNAFAFSHISAPVGGEDGLLYALVKTAELKKQKKCHLIRIQLPMVTNNGDSDNMHNVDNIVPLVTYVINHNKENRSVGNESTTPDGKHCHVKSFPFALSSQCCERNGIKGYYVALVQKRGLTIYYENKYLSQNQMKNSNVQFFTQEKDQCDICVAAMAPNGEDMALGFSNGKIDILVSILSQTASFIENSLPAKDHPRTKLLRRTIHWHSLPVKSLCYLGLPGSRAAPSLLSGGEEAVLITWNVERGLNRPTYTLPRIAKGCITHITTNMYPISTSIGGSEMDIVVRCMDNTLQLIQGHNHSVRWKIQGLATLNNECVESVAPDGELSSAILCVDPRTQVPIMTRLSGAPGFLHWYDVKTCQVVGDLEVAPYNRISRKEPNHKAYPRPLVTDFVLSSSGNDMITIDTMLTENETLGKNYNVNPFIGGGNDLSEKMALVSNMKFWSWSRELESSNTSGKQDKGMPYELVSAMPNPHGQVNGKIDALAIAPAGNRACTLSMSEGTFHIWGKGKRTSTGISSLAPATPSWRRLFKITIPSGFSNSVKDQSGKDTNSTMAFSADGSIVAIAFGRHVTLWDHTNATLLNTICAPDCLRDIQFVSDMILTVGKSSVSILPPFGGGYMGSTSWSYKLPEDTIVAGIKLVLGQVTPLASRKEIAVALKETWNGKKKVLASTKIVLIDIMTGEAKKRKDGSSCTWNLQGDVHCMCDISNTKQDWASDDAVLLVLTDQNKLYVLDADDNHGKLISKENTRGCFANIESSVSNNPLSSTDVPKLESQKRKRKVAGLGVEDDVEMQSTNDSMIGKGSLLFEGSGSQSEALLTAQLPTFSGGFTSAFIARNLKKLKI